MIKNKFFRTDVRSDNEHADIPAVVEFTIDAATAREIIRLSEFVKAKGLYKVEKFDWRARYFQRNPDDPPAAETQAEENEVRTDADVLNISDTEFWFSAYFKHTNVEILSEQQSIKDLAAHFNLDPDITGSEPTVGTPNETGSDQMYKMYIAVACCNGSGMADLPVFTVTATPKEICLGIHYDRAKALAKEAGYEEPFVCFDADEQGAILSAARHLDQVPQVIVIDMTRGLVHSVCCDAGEIKVICYDESDIDEDSEVVAEYPVGENGQLIRCWAHVQTADVDPGLKKAR